MDDGAEALAPGSGLESALPQIDGDRPARIDRQSRAVRIGDLIELDPSRRGDEHLDFPQVLRAGADATRIHLPSAVIAPMSGQAHGRVIDQRRRSRRVAGLPGQERDGQGSRRPQGEGRERSSLGSRSSLSALGVWSALGAPGCLRFDEADAQWSRAVSRRGGASPEAIDQRPDLHTRESREPAARGRGRPLDDGELAGQKRFDVRAPQTGITEVVDGGQRQVAAQLWMSGHDLGADLADQDEGNLGAVGAAMQQSVPNMGLSIGGGDQPEADGRGAAGAAMVRTHAHSGGDPFGKQVGGPCQSRFIDPVSPGLPGPGDGAPHRSLMVTLQIRNNRPDRGYGTVRGLRADTRVVSHVHHLPDDTHSLACWITSRQDRKTQLEPANETINWRSACDRTDFDAEMNRSRHRAPDLIMWTVRVGARVRARMGMYRGYAGGPAQAPPNPPFDEVDILERDRRWHRRSRSRMSISSA